MSETTQAKESLKPAPNVKIPSLLSSGTSDCSRVALLLFSLRRRSQRRRCYCIDFAFPGVAVRRPCGGRSPQPSCCCRVACYPSDRRQVDQSFPAGPGSAARVPYRGTRLGCFCGGEFAPLRFACAFGKHRSALREHFSLSDAWFVVDNGLLARSPGDSKCLRFQHGHAGRESRWTVSTLSTSASSH